MTPWELAARVKSSHHPPLARFDNRIGGDPLNARTELLLLSEFATALQQLEYRHELFLACWRTMEQSVSKYKDPRQSIPWHVTNPEALACWFEFEALLGCAAAFADRVGKILALSHPGLEARRLDANIHKLGHDQTLSWAIRKHGPWLAYLADLRNVSMHRLLVSHLPAASVALGNLRILLPDHTALADRSMNDPRDLTFVEDRDMRETTLIWRDGLPQIIEAVFDDYFSSRGR